jgi:iron(III) transport system substrate-binding protein
VKVIGFNSDKLNKETAPQDWDELLDAKWRGQVIIRSPMESGTMKSVFAAMVYRSFSQDGKPDRGYQWLGRLDANTKSYAASPATLMLMIGRQEGLVTLWDLTDILLQKREQNVPMGFVIPRSGALVLNEGIAIVKGAPHRAEAERFYEFVTSKKALLHQAERFYRIPARLDISDGEKPDWLRSITITELPVDWNAIGAHREEWMQYWDQHIKGQNR